jgi:hypothetical protein
MPPRRQILSGKAVLQLAVLVLLLLVAMNYQTILDDYALTTFHPATDVQGIENNLDLTHAARATFYRSAPQIDSKAAFNKDCDTKPHELELGCYWRGHIYVMKIDNQSLASEMDVVTAHELLHAEWSRMSSSERKSIGTELERVYSTLGNPELQQRMADYAVSEPGEQDNELHSILGTEFQNLSPMLEAHYSKYFSDRTAIVTAHNSYLQVFSSRKSQLEAELANIRAEKSQLNALNSEMDGLRASGRIASYNALVPRQNRLVDQINTQITAYQAGVDEYNALSVSLDSQAITDTESPAQSQ